MLTLALAKGRILEEALPLLKRAGLEPEGGESVVSDRRIMVGCSDPNVRLILVRASDVQTYVSFGAAQAGLVGRDLMQENPIEGLVYGDDLNIAGCRLVIAARKGYDYKGAIERGEHLTVATKYPRLARRFLAAQGIQAQIVRLYGSMELAPTVGLSDVIVDLSASGETIRANNLVEVDSLMDVTTHLVFNQAATWRRREQLDDLAARFAKALDGTDNSTG